MKPMNDTICVIPARRGSKRLRLKNLREINGKPMIAYTIEAAINSKHFDAVYVATEDKEIAEVARKYGAVVPTLVPKKMCGDLRPSWEPCVFLIDYLEKKEGKVFENLLCLQPTSVLKKSVDVVEGMKVFKKGKYDFLVSVTPIDPHYFHWAVVPETGSKNWHMYFGKKFLKERKFLPEMYRPNGAIKIAQIASLKKHKSFFGPNLGASMMPEERSLHVINEADLKIAAALLTP